MCVERTYLFGKYVHKALIELKRKLMRVLVLLDWPEKN